MAKRLFCGVFHVETPALAFDMGGAMPYFQGSCEELRELNATEKTLVKVIAFGAFFTAFDFTLYFYFNDAITSAFLPDTMPAAWQQWAFLVMLMVGYASRPLGGIWLGGLGDRIGRKPIMLLSLLLMSVSTLLIGCLPTYHQCGLLALVLLVALRFVQGVGVGAEVPTLWVYLAEHMPRWHLGAMCGWLMAMFIASALLANVMSWLLASMLTPLQMMTVGWRVPFIVGAIGTLAAMALRYHLTETPLWLQWRHSQTQDPSASTAAHQPLRQALRHQRYGIGVSCALSLIVSSLYVTVLMLMPSLAINYFDMDDALMWIANGVAALFAALGSVVFGYYADRFNTGRVFAIASFMLIISSLTFFAVLQLYPELMLIAYALLGFCVGLIGIVPSVCVRLFPAQVRLSGVAFCYNMAFALVGGLTTLLVNYFTQQLHFAPLLYLTFVGIIGVMVGMMLDNLHGLYRMEDNPTLSKQATF